MTKYLSGMVNFNSHKEAELYFEKLSPEVALSNNIHVNLMKDGTATINYLQDEPVQHSQCEYIVK